MSRDCGRPPAKRCRITKRACLQGYADLRPCDRKGDRCNTRVATRQCWSAVEERSAEQRPVPRYGDEEFSGVWLTGRQEASLRSGGRIRVESRSEEHTSELQS